MKFDQNREKFQKMVFDQNQITNMFVAQDALSAKIAEQLGYQAIFVAGYATSAVDLGLPDRGVSDFDIMLNKCREIINATNLPVFADADTGYGNQDNIARTIQNYEQIGAAGVFLEDQKWPKKCGHMEGKKIEHTDVLADKIKTAVKNRKNNNFLIMSRTDARAVFGLDEAIKRSKKYQAAGADMIFIKAPESIEKLKLIKQDFPSTPLMANMIEEGKTPDLTVDELKELGFSIVVHPTTSVYTEAYSIKKMLETLQKDGSTKNITDQMITFNQFNDFIGLNDLNNFENENGDLTMKQKIKEWGL